MEYISENPESLGFANTSLLFHDQNLFNSPLYAAFHEWMIWFFPCTAIMFSIFVRKDEVAQS